MKTRLPPAQTTVKPPLRPLVGVSSCLLGAPVRYNGGHSRSRFLTDELDRHVNWLPVCPEAEIGLGVPRPTLRLQRRDGEDRVVSSKDGTDVSDELAGTADQHFAQLRRLDGYVLKNKSPSCGLFALPVFDEAGNRVDGKGRGAFARRLTALLPSLPVEEQGRLCDPVLREQFAQRVFAHARLRALWESPWRTRDLVELHTRHKLQLMSHSPDGYRETGRIVARAGTVDREQTVASYTEAFHRAMAVLPSRGRHVNALQHAFGMLSSLLDDARRHDLLEAIQDYRREQVPLSVPVALLRHHCAAEEVAWARNQTYLRPYPDDLRLRHAVSV
ncbi:YbgA family protein [Nocardiopsis sp. NPDC058631]|uniref:YbgA family protein n=1 Tax=Nocardiopsis sp. NPDC058631 TaxID=3346566 RepID=UPI00366663F2